MNKTIAIVFSVLIGLLMVPIDSRAVADAATELLEPDTEHRFATRLATRFLTSYHYRRLPLDDELSERMFDQYIKLLDPNRMYFLASDIEDLSRYRTHLDDALNSADLAPAFDIFNLYRRRAIERIEHAGSLLDGEFEFDVDERYRFDRTDEEWATDSAELDEIWRQRVKNDWLGLMMAEREVDDIRETLGERYGNIERRIKDFNSQDVFQFFLNAYAQSIEPHSSYMSPRLADNFEISMKLSLDGIGALLSSQSEYVEVQDVVAGGPADIDGRLQSGDRIVGVGQGEDDAIVDVVGWRLDDVVELIRGERESVVRLEVLPAETGLKGPSTIIQLVRNEVKLEQQAAKAHVEEVEIDGQPRRIGIIQVPVFYVDFRGRARNEPNYRSSTRDVRNLIQDMRAEGVDGLVVDLRDNGGGALIEATTMTGLFIDEGPVVQVRDSSGRISVEEDREPGMAWDGPLAVLVNRGSASASEIFAAAIQDYGRGIIIGEPTFGKGTVQNLFNLDDYANDKADRLGQVKLTMAQFFRVNGGSTQSKGVIPDIRLPTFGDPEEYGESALEFALPWTEISEARYRPVADLAPLLPRAEQRHQERRRSNEDLADLISDYAEFEERFDRTSVSLLLSERQAEHDKAEARRKERFSSIPGSDTSTPDTDPLSDSSDGSDPGAPASASDGSGDGDGDGDGHSGSGSADESDSNSDIAEDQIEDLDVLLRESARILADLIELDQSQHRLVQVREPATAKNLDQ